MSNIYLCQGGTDQGMPIIVSRVAPGSQADVCIPRLNEGDQVLYINGRDVSQHTHEQVKEICGRNCMCVRHRSDEAYYSLVTAIHGGGGLALSSMSVLPCTGKTL